MCVLHGPGAVLTGCGAQWSDVDAEAVLYRGAGCLGAFLAAGAQHNIGAFPGQHHRGALADRAGSSEDHYFLAGYAAAGQELGGRGCGGGVAAVAVEHDGDAEIREEDLLHRVQQLFTGDHVAAADKKGGIFLFFRAAGEDGAFYQGAHVVGGATAMADDMVGAAVKADYRVENCGMGIGVQLEQKFFHQVILVILDYGNSGKE